MSRALLRRPSDRTRLPSRLGLCPTCRRVVVPVIDRDEPNAVRCARCVRAALDERRRSS